MADPLKMSASELGEAFEMGTGKWFGNVETSWNIWNSSQSGTGNICCRNACIVRLSQIPSQLWSHFPDQEGNWGTQGQWTRPCICQRYTSGSFRAQSWTLLWEECYDFKEMNVKFYLVPFGFSLGLWVCWGCHTSKIIQSGHTCRLSKNQKLYKFSKLTSQTRLCAEGTLHNSPGRNPGIVQ